MVISRSEHNRDVNSLRIVIYFELKGTSQYIHLVSKLIFIYVQQPSIFYI